MAYRKLQIHYKKKTSKRPVKKSKILRRVRKSQKSQKKMRGGNCASFSNLPMKHYYPMNSYNNDPQSLQSSSRLEPNPMSGGKKTFKIKSEKMRKFRAMKNKTMKGGNLFSDYSNATSYPFNNTSSLVSSMGNISSAFSGTNLLFGYQNTPSTVTNIPKPDYLV
jgi:hypothetical protein